MTERAPVGAWRTATVRSVEHPSVHAAVLRLEIPDRIGHLPGQHYAIRLSAEDGYVAQRSYSIASPPSDPLLEFYVERHDGEVSSFLADGAEVGDELDVRGPIGGWFVWRADGPALGIGGGSGAVPLVAMMRHAAAVGRADLLEVAVSARTPGRLPYADELAAFGALVAITREPAPTRDANAAPAAFGTRHTGRLTVAELAPRIPASGPCFVCGSSVFADAATDLLAGAGVAVDRIRVERFGPSG